MTFQRIKGVLKQAIGEPQLKKFLDKSEEFERVYQMRKDYVVPVNQTLVLVSQVQRSGGSLMSQLFDGHPELHAHPAELYIGHPEKQDFPDLDLTDTPEQWFSLLYEEPSLKNFLNGYKKFPESAQYDKPDIFPFLLLPNLQRELFLHVVSQATIKTQRDIIDCYMTSYFNAWLDYQGLYQPKKFITAFVPRLSMVKDSMERYFRDYPDGKLISVIREPKGWYGSSHRQRPHVYPTPEAAIPFWMESAKAMIDNKTRYGDKIFLIAFDSLLKDTAGTMQKLAAWMGLTWDDILTEPTFQRMPIKANTAFSTNTYGVIDAPLKREKDVDPADAQYIDAQTTDLYHQVLDLVD